MPAGWSIADTEKFRNNQGLVNSVVTTKNNINIKVDDVSLLEEWASSNPSQGTHAWIAVDINTGVDDITFNGHNSRIWPLLCWKNTWLQNK